VAKISSQI